MGSFSSFFSLYTLYMNFFFHISEGISVVIVVVVVVVGSPDFVNRNCEEFGGGGEEFHCLRSIWDSF